jgi:transglutaminase-like putative cysteine protease
MKRHWIIVFLVLLSGILVIAFLNARPQPIQDTPINLPKLRDIVPAGTSTARGLQVLDDSYIPTLVKPTTLVRTTTDRLMKQSCEFGTANCKLQAIYDFTRLNLEFSERTPETPYIRTPAEVLLLARGDELELALLLASMQRAAGFQNEIIRTSSGSRTWVRTRVGNSTIMIDVRNQGSPVMASSVSLRGDELIYN